MLNIKVITKKHIRMNMPLFFLDKVDSTMNEIKKSKYKNYSNVAILAKQQTNGRGRRKNLWESKKGNLYLSVKLKRKIKSNHHLTTYMVSIIVHDTIKEYLAKNSKIFIKWPNDIYIYNKKVAGILIEFQSSGNKVTEVIIGIGVNINSNPDNLKKSTTHISKYSNFKVKSIDLTESILSRINYWTKLLSNNKKIILKEWMSRSKQLNTVIKFYYKNKKMIGIYKGIQEDGSIKVMIEDKINNFFNLEMA